MPTRRVLLLSAAALAVAAATARYPWVIAPAAAAAAADAASAFIKQTGAALTAVVNSDLGDAARRQRLGQVVDQSVDVDAVGRFCLGRYWRLATPQQQHDYLALFHQVMIYSIAGHLGEYKGVSFTVDRTVAHEGETAVRTTLVRPGNPPAQVDWVVSTATGTPRIIDLVAEGTSLRLTQRNDYASFLGHNGDNLQSLIDALRKQVEGGT